MDLRLIQHLLQARPQIAQWQITERRQRRLERYLAFLEPESERETWRCEWRVWLALPAANGRQGEASFTVTPAHGNPELRALLDAALLSAANADSPAWQLPGPGEAGVAAPQGACIESCSSGAMAGGAQRAVAYDSVADTRVLRDPRAAIEATLAEFCAAAREQTAVRASTLELFTTIEQRRLVNHRGLDLSEQRTRCYAEFVLLHRPPGSDEVEYYERCEAQSLPGLQLTQRVNDAAACLRAGAQAERPPSGQLPVVIGGEYLAALLRWFATHADAALHVRSIAALALQQPVTDPGDGDRLQLASDARVPSLAAYRFDEHGYAASYQELIRDGVLVGLHGQGRWMQVLGRPPRGQCATLCVPAGSIPAEALRSEALEVLRFSEFHPRHDSGAFSGEIRFAWWHRPDGSRVPVRGGSVSGVLRQAFAAVRFSAETHTIADYCGPCCARFPATVTAG